MVPNGRGSARACRLAATHDGDQRGEQIWVAEGDPHLARPGDRHARHDEVDPAGLERRDELVPLELPQLEGPAESPRQLAGKVDLETGEPASLGRNEGR